MDDSMHAITTLTVNIFPVGALNVEKDSSIRLDQNMYAQMKHVHSEKPDVQAVKMDI